MTPAMTNTPTPEQLAKGLVDLLTVERAGENRFIGTVQPGGVGRVFGGQVVAQALQSAQLTAPAGMQAHSLHAYFLRGGREGIPIEYHVENDFDGRSFANRKVVALQENIAMLNLTASFQRPEDGLSHIAAEMPDIAQPEDLEPDTVMRRRFLDSLDEVSETQRAIFLRPRPIEIRSPGAMHWMSTEKREPCTHSWFRVVDQVPDDPRLHRAMIAYASDYTLLGTAALPHGLSWARGELRGASLDHALWFHRPARADEWLLYTTFSPWSGAGRGFNQGRIFNRRGKLVASVAQEGVIRPAKGD